MYFTGIRGRSQLLPTVPGCSLCLGSLPSRCPRAGRSDAFPLFLSLPERRKGTTRLDGDNTSLVLPKVSGQKGKGYGVEQSVSTQLSPTILYLLNFSQNFNKIQFTPKRVVGDGRKEAVESDVRERGQNL